MEAICSSETSGDTQCTTRRYIPEDGTLHNHRCENLKSYIAEIRFLRLGPGFTFHALNRNAEIRNQLYVCNLKEKMGTENKKP
jgi:hypothetical protein